MESCHQNNDSDTPVIDITSSRKSADCTINSTGMYHLLIMIDTTLIMNQLL